MDWNRVEGNWKQVKGKIKEKWGNLADDDLTAINGQRDQLEGKIQERYGIAKDQVKRDVHDWYKTQSWWEDPAGLPSAGLLSDVSGCPSRRAIRCPPTLAGGPKE